VFQHKEKAGKHLKTEGSLPNVEMIPPCTTNNDKNEIIKQSQLVTTRLSTSKPPIPAPRAINLPEVGSNEKSTSEVVTSETKYTTKTPPPIRPPRKNSPSMCLKHGKKSFAPAQGEPIHKTIEDRNEHQNSKSGLFDKVGKFLISI
jgi:hypothetical protein